MIIQLIAFVFIALLVSYLVFQGTLSAIMVFASAAFASIFAMGTYEYWSGFLETKWPDFARGTAFYLTFFLAFSAVRLACDWVVPKNIVLPIIIDRVLAGAIGLFAALLVVGSAIIGMELMPLSNALLGFNRFPSGMVDDDGRPLPPKSIFLMPDNFVVGLWNIASGGAMGTAMGGGPAFTAVHPDFLRETYGYRRNVQLPSQRTAPQDLVKVQDARILSDAQELQHLGITEQDRRDREVLLVRVQVLNGEQPPHNTADIDSQFRITPTEVRVATTAGQLLYPSGFLNNGTTFTAVTPDTPMVDDYVGMPPQVIHDWVFFLPAQSDVAPAYFEVKQLARFAFKVHGDEPAPAIAVGVGPLPVLAVNAYPTRPYAQAKNNATLNLTASTLNTAAKAEVNYPNVAIYVFPADIRVRLIKTQMTDANDKLLENMRQMDTGNQWTATKGMIGVPDFQQLKQARIPLQNVVNKAPAEMVDWQEILPGLVMSRLTPDGAENVNVIYSYMQNELVPLIKAQGNVVLFTTDKDGQTGDQSISPGNYAILATYKDAASSRLIVWEETRLLEKSAKVIDPLARHVLLDIKLK